MNFAVVYSRNTGRVRWIVYPASDKELDNLKTGDGEASLVFDNSLKADLFTLQELINKTTGIKPADDRYAVIDEKGIVTATIIADPLCGDAVKDCKLIADPVADVGDVYDEKTGFTKVNEALKTG